MGPTCLLFCTTHLFFIAAAEFDSTCFIETMLVLEKLVEVWVLVGKAYWWATVVDIFFTGIACFNSYGSA
jgi:hypothetical protein